jgi:hypothetical protein
LLTYQCTSAIFFIFILYKVFIFALYADTFQIAIINSYKSNSICTHESYNPVQSVQNPVQKSSKIYYIPPKLNCFRRIFSGAKRKSAFREGRTYIIVFLETIFDNYLTVSPMCSAIDFFVIFHGMRGNINTPTCTCTHIMVVQVFYSVLRWNITSQESHCNL